MIESPSALDMLGGRTESETLRAVCKLLEHDFAAISVRSRSEFRTALSHVTSINVSELSASAQKRPLCLHVAAHGNTRGLAFGADIVEWEELGEDLWRFLKRLSHYPGPIILVLSACGAEKQTCTKEFARRAKVASSAKPPAYVLTTVSNDSGDVYWHDSVVAWSIFYHQIGAAVLTKRGDIKTILDKIRLTGAGALKYFRWDEADEHYASYESAVDEHRH